MVVELSYNGSQIKSESTFNAGYKVLGIYPSGGFFKKFRQLFLAA